MRARATTTVSVLRGTDEDEYGDEEDADNVIARNVPASIIERTRRVFDQGSSTPRIIRYVSGRIDPRADIEFGDRVKDEKTGKVYVVDSYSVPDNPVYKSDMNLELRIP